MNLYELLETGFPKDKSSCAIETHDGLYYSWDDLEKATSKMANLLAGLKLPQGSRVAVQVEKSPEALFLYLATLKAGLVYLPLNTAYQSAEIEYFLGNAEPAVVVCSPKNHNWVTEVAKKVGTPIMTVERGMCLMSSFVSKRGNQIILLPLSNAP